MTIKQAPAIETCPVTGFTLYGCQGCAFLKKWQGESKSSCKFERMRAGESDNAIEDKKIADSMRTYWIESQSGAEPFGGGNG